MGRWADARGRGELANLKEITKYLKFLQGVWVFSIIFSERF